MLGCAVHARVTGHFYVSNVVVRLRELVNRDYRTPPLFIAATFTHLRRDAAAYRTGLALLCAQDARFTYVHEKTAALGSAPS